MYNQNESLMNHENFLLPAMVENDFTPEELAEDMEGIQMSFQRVKIPSGGMLQFELPLTIGQPDYAKIWRASSFINHSNNAYWAEGDEYDDNNTAPLCSSVDGKMGLENPAASALPVHSTSMVQLPKGTEKPAKICGFFTCSVVAITCLYR